MDENYLDSLLNEVSLDKEIDHKIEDELDNQIQKEKRQYQEQQILSDEDLFNMDLELDAGDIQNQQDIYFSEEQIEELDQLDDFADMDIGDLDFSDIDFNDIDVTKLEEVTSDDLDELLGDFEGDLDISKLFDSSDSDATLNQDDEGFNLDISDINGVDATDETELHETESQVIEPQVADLNEDTFDTDQFLDSLLNETTLPPEDDAMSISEPLADTGNTSQDDDDASNEFDLLKALEEFEENPSAQKETEQEKEVSQLSDSEKNELDDILSMLDLDDITDNTTSEESVSQQVNQESNSVINLDDLEELPNLEKDKKQRFMEVLFGEPDEDDILSEKELEENENKKAEKKKKKQQLKEAKKEKEQQKKDAKIAKNNEKKKNGEEKKRIRAQLREQEKIYDTLDKKLNKPAVAFIFSLFLGATLLFFVGTNNFNYKQAIEKATKYFANQKYRKAYDEIVGVEVKEKDVDLKNRIYTVMYVERLYESYLNNLEMGRHEKALDSLLRGVTKYYEHYEEAVELGISSDIDYSFEQIRQALSLQYGITVEDAVRINQLENYEYVQYIESVVGNRTEENNSDDVLIPEKQEEVMEE